MGGLRGDGWVSPGSGVEALFDELADVGTHTRRMVEQHDLTVLATVGGRFTTPEAAAQLQWIFCMCCRSMPAYARLDSARADGLTAGEFLYNTGSVALPGLRRHGGDLTRRAVPARCRHPVRRLRRPPLRSGR